MQLWEHVPIPRSNVRAFYLDAFSRSETCSSQKSTHSETCFYPSSAVFLFESGGWVFLESISVTSTATLHFEVSLVSLSLNPHSLRTSTENYFR